MSQIRIPVIRLRTLAVLLFAGATAPCWARQVVLEDSELAMYVGVPLVFGVSAVLGAAVLARRSRRRAPAAAAAAPAGEPVALADLRRHLSASRRSITRLEESRGELGYLLGALSEGVVLCDPGGNVRWVNARAESLTGLSLAESVKKPLCEVLRLVDEHGGNPVELRLDPDAEARLPENVGALVVRGDGQTVPVELTVLRPSPDCAVKPSVVILLRDVADRSRVQEELARMVQSYLAMAATMQRAVGNTASDSGSFHQNIGYLYFLRGSHRDALEHYEKALRIREREYGAGHTVTAATHNDIGRVHLSAGDADAALGYFDRALAIRRQTGGRGNPELADSYHALGTAHHAKGQLVQALEHYASALSVREEALGSDHIATAASCMSIGHAHWDLRAYLLARSHYGRALTILAGNLGDEHAQTGHALLCLGATCVLLGLQEEAERYLQRAFNALRRTLGPLHPETSNAASWLAQMHDQAGNRQKAHETRQVALFTNPLNRRYL